MSFRLLELNDDAIGVVLAEIDVEELRAFSATCKHLRVLLMPAVVCAQGYVFKEQKLVSSVILLNLFATLTLAVASALQFQDQLQDRINNITARTCEAEEEVQKLLRRLTAHPLPFSRGLRNAAPARLRQKVGPYLQNIALNLTTVAGSPGLNLQLPALPDLTAYPDQPAQQE
mgnify:CR=1 FL=1|tara:strand:+ start:373 stop:891 length:519 start_codon:yes stop_codon:yes gene_type:complete